jgi:7-cyano-7-deazaguanine synthase
MPTKKVLVLHSGGLDSTTCLYQAHAEGHQVLSLGVDYGQKLSIEMLFAERQCAQRGIPREVIRLGWHKPERVIPLHRSVEEMRVGVSSAFLPGRNIVFLALGYAHAAGLHMDEIVIGLNCVDFSGYPDCTVEFFESFRAMIDVGSPHGPALVAPLLRLTKPEIAARAIKLGLGPNDTWSCYRPEIKEGAVVPCGQCDACKLHDFAWAEQEVKRHGHDFIRSLRQE